MSSTSSSALTAEPLQLLRLDGAVPGLSRRAVRLEGGWSANRTRGFRGSVTCEAPMTALLLATADGVTRWVKAERPGEGPLVLELALFPFGPPTFETQISFGCHGAGLRHAVRREREAAVPEIAVPRLFSTGEPVRITTIAAHPEVVLHLLCLAGRDVETGRAGLWRLRSAVLSEVPEPWATVLSRRRIGAFSSFEGAPAEATA